MIGDGKEPRPAIRGRGAADNPANRFVPLHLDAFREVGDEPEEGSAPRTLLFRDTSRTVLSRNDSPDVGGEYTMNPYRGCEHGCVYCYARPTHEYLGLSAGLDFESKLFVKEDAPELLRRELASPRWEPNTVMMSGVTDAYQPIERRLELARRCLEVFAESRNPVAIVTKSQLVTRDIDVLTELAKHDAGAVAISVTSLDETLAAVLEPRAARPPARLETIRALAAAGIPVGVNVAPVIPGLTDHELPSILEAARAAGARFAGYVMLRLPYAVAPLFEQWLARHRPEARDKVVHRIQSMRGGKMNDSTFGTRMRGEGIFAEQVAALFKVYTRRFRYERWPSLSRAHFQRPVLPGAQLALF